MIGGGSDLDEAFYWLCQKGNGGDFLILRASGSDAYNSYINGLCKLNSVATLILPDRQAAQDPAVAAIIRQAEVVFIAGGDQANYIVAWKDTPVQDAINADLAEGKPIGGTSAGLAVLGEFVYGALGDPPDGRALVSADVLPNPYSERVTLIRGFLKIPNLENLLTDSHFAKRDRMGRTLVFLARIIQDGWSKSPREVAIDEKSAVLVEPDGKGTVLGSGKLGGRLRLLRLAKIDFGAGDHRGQTGAARAGPGPESLDVPSAQLLRIGAGVVDVMQRDGDFERGVFGKLHLHLVRKVHHELLGVGIVRHQFELGGGQFGLHLGVALDQEAN